LRWLLFDTFGGLVRDLLTDLYEDDEERSRIAHCCSPQPTRQLRSSPRSADGTHHMTDDDCLADVADDGPGRPREGHGMGLLTFSLNVTLDGCVDHAEGIADDETHAHFTRLMDGSGAMLWGRTTYEMMEAYWPAVARGDVDAPRAMREWALKLETKPKFVVSSTRSAFPWTNSHHLAGDLGTAVQDLKERTPRGVLVGSGRLATALDRLGLIDEYSFLVHPMIAGHGPTLYADGLPSTRRLDLISAEPLGNGAVAMHYRRAE